MRQVDGEKSECVIPGEVCSSAYGLMSSRDGVMGEQKSAEGIVAIARDGEGPNVMSGLRPSLDGRNRCRQEG